MTRWWMRRALNSRMAEVVDSKKSEKSRMCVYIAMLDYESDDAHVLEIARWWIRRVSTLEWPSGG